MTAVSGHHKIKTRKVFYIPGFDPQPPRRYRELYRREGKKQAEISGYALKQGLVPDQPASSWRIDADFDGDKTQTDFECLIWSDIVKASMTPSLWNIYVKSFYYYSNYILSGSLFRILKVRIGPAIVALYPPLVTAFQLAIGVLLAVTLVDLFDQLVIGLPIAALGVAVWIWLMRRLDKYLYAHYLMLDYTYFAKGNGALPEGLGDRLNGFTDRVKKAFEGDYDEVLIVGHSSGAQLAVNLAAKILGEGHNSTSQLGVLTLGHSIPMASFLPEAQYMRGDLQFLSEQDDITWLDVSAPGDGACFALADPVAISGVATEAQKHPKILSAVYSRTLSDQQKRELRGRFFKKHFQYLCAFQHPDNYDYFKITAGPTAFAELVAGLKESPSKITKTYSGYTDV